MKKYIPIIFILILFNCGGSSAPEIVPDNIVTHEIDLKKVEDDVKFSDVVEDYRFITLEATNESLVGRANKVLFTSEFIFILDRFNTKSVFQFDKQGKFLRKIGRGGIGPGEYSTPLDVTFKDNKIFVLDEGVSIIVYDSNGEYLERLKLGGSGGLGGFYFEKLEQGWAFIGSGRLENIIITDDNFNIKKSYFPWISRSTDILIHGALTRDFEGNVLYRRKYKDTIYQVNSDGLSARLAIDYKSNQFDLSELESETADKFIENNIHKYAVTNRVYLANRTTYIATLYNSEKYVYISKKGNPQTTIYNERNLINDITHVYNSGFSITSYEDYIVYVYEPEEIKKGVSAALGTGDSVDERVLELSNNLPDGANPVLMLIKFKPKAK